MFFPSLNIQKLFLCILCRIPFKGVIGNPYFQWMHLSKRTNMSQIERSNAFECKETQLKGGGGAAPLPPPPVDFYTSALSLFVCLFLGNICNEFST